MRVVLDTNVLVPAALRDRGPERVVLFVAETPEIEWVVCEEIVAEYLEVLSRPRFGLQGAVLLRWKRLLTSITTFVEHRFSRSLIRAKTTHRGLAGVAARAAWRTAGLGSSYTKWR